MAESKPIFFSKPEQWRKWLEDRRDTEKEVWLGFHKKASGIPSITWDEAVDQALCFGWIDGLRKSIDEDSYKIRFTPRRAGSIWSEKNSKRVAALKKMGLMHEDGIRAFAGRKEARSGVYSFEQRSGSKLNPAQEKLFRANAKAWRWFSEQAPYYKKSAIWWVVSAKQEKTRQKRLDELIADSAAGRRIKLMRPNEK